MNEEQLHHIDYIENNEDKEDTTDFVEQSLTRKIDILKKEIEYLYTDIRTRNNLHEDITKELDSMIKNCHIQLESFPKGSSSWGSYFESNIGKLEKEISDLKKESRLEKVGRWRNKVKLKKELRDLLKEYESLMKRKEFLKEFLADQKH